MRAEFFETFKLLNGQLCNQEFHLDRIRRTQTAFFDRSYFEIADLYAALIDYPEGLFKIRVDYTSAITHIRAELYEIKTHHRLGLADAGSLDYRYKFADRTFFRETLTQYPECDDLLYLKDGLVTDTTYCNVALFDGHKWVTPATFLLPGTKRAALLAGGALQTATVSGDDLPRYKAIAFINAMRDFEKKYTFVRDHQALILTEI